jgi:hypothetical protein
MAFVEGDIVVKQIGDKDWLLVEPVVYEGLTEVFIVPAGFETDLASVPRQFVWLIPRYGRYTKAAILHDYLWRNRDQLGLTRRDADGIFRRAMRELAVPFLQRWMMWAAVRWAAGPAPAQLPCLLAVSIPAAVFVAVPGVVITVWLVAFWLAELPVYVVLRVHHHFWGGRKEVNPPELDMTLG